MKTTRRQFLASSAALPAAGQSARPNVLLIITDDQGYGDLSCHGNPHLKTPNLDSLARDGVEFTQFHSCPVCSPTRSSLMTGRYNYRTGVVDTYLGRSMMYPDEVTLAELLGGAGYRTAIFGKWHLGDNYPMRAMDQGFQEAVVHNGGGLSQPADVEGEGSYFDPLLLHNGRPQRYRGYCSDVYAGEAVRFLTENRNHPFFIYLPFNAPHTPLQVDQRLADPFLKTGLDETTAKVYGMVSNIDENVGRVLTALRSQGLEDNTIVVFLTDNGPQQDRYNAGMRGRKGTVYEGGIRVPFFVRWPRALKAGRKVDRVAAHIDVVPTLLEACGVAAPKGLRLDGRSLLGLARGQGGRWSDRTLFFQWHRGDEPEAFRACAARNQRYKLVDGKELYDLEKDPSEKEDIASANPEMVARLRRAYQEWFRDVSSTRGYAPPRPHLGTDHENPVVLSRQDWRGPQAAWNPDSLGYWEVEVARPGNYDITFRFNPRPAPIEARFALGGVQLKFDGPLPPGAVSCQFPRVPLPKGPGRLEAVLTAGGKQFGVNYVSVKREGPR